jgi:prepilin-type N-terminal cleavage/methylation domain-containing protein
MKKQDLSRKKSAITGGLSLIELLVSLAIIALLSSFTAPGIKQLLHRRSQQIALETLFHLSVYSRNEAIKFNDYFTVCPTVDKQRCNGQWNKTVMVFRDSNKNETIDSDEKLAKLLSLPPSTPCIDWRSAAENYLQFRPSGASNGSAGHFRFCDRIAQRLEKKVVVSLNGRTSIKDL